MDSAASTTVPIIYSLLPPLNDGKAEDGFVSIPRASNNRNIREKRSGSHFDPNRFHYPSPFLAQPGRGGNVKGKEGLIDKEKDSISGGNNNNEGGRVNIGNNNNNNNNEHQKIKKQKHKKETRKAKVAKSKTHGMALQKGGTERPHSRNDGNTSSQYTLTTHTINASYQPTLSTLYLCTISIHSNNSLSMHPLDAPSRYNDQYRIHQPALSYQPIHPINPPKQYTLSTHPINPPTVSTHPINASSRATFSTHPINPSYQSIILSIHSPSPQVRSRIVTKAPHPLKTTTSNNNDNVTWIWIYWTTPPTTTTSPRMIRQD